MKEPLGPGEARERSSLHTLHDTVDDSGIRKGTSPMNIKMPSSKSGKKPIHMVALVAWRACCISHGTPL